jgi:CarD family transcriptional regulator
MSEQRLPFQIGDQVIHWAYGPGVIVQLDRKELLGKTGQYYVVKTRDLTLWVPVNQSGEKCLRYPTPAKDFEKLFRLLASPGAPLSSDRFERKNQLSERMNHRSIESICQVIRDLVYHKRIKQKMNDNDNSLLNHARSLLLEEWSIALSVPIQQAEKELDQLLESK